MDSIPNRFLRRIQAAKRDKLEVLDLRSNYSTDDKKKLTKIPDEVFELKHLRVLNLNNNRISELSELLRNLTNLTELKLCNNQLSSLPESFGNLNNLRTLDLSYNQLSSLPESFGSLANLRTLDLSYNQLSSLPESFGSLANLMTLDLRENKLSILPESFINLANLSNLDLWNNQLSKLPESFGDLTNLIILDLSRNKISIIPKTFEKLTNLVTLDLGANQLSYLPDFIVNLYSLEELYLGANNLSSLPDFIVNLTNLKRLFLNKNPLVNPPIEIAEKGVESVREYFRQQKEVGTDRIYEAKLLIVGEAGAGKTTLAQKIKNPDYQLKQNEKSTEGIDIIKYTFPLDNGKKFQINIWDFGGQEIYHATHRFFLTKRSLYCLVVDNRKEDNNLYYWLNIVELLSDNSPLLIIKNEKQDRTRDINERSLKGQFENLKETLATNLGTNKQLDKILKCLKYYITNLEHIGSELPATWVKVRESLDNDNRNYISLQEYLNICDVNGFTRDEDKLQLSEYLHDLGVCLHFQDKEESLLYKTIILKPEWGTDAVYKVLDNKQVVNNQGYFTRNDLKNIWQDNKYSSMRGELLELMKKFELCYELHGNKDTFIAPQLLSDNQPEYDWDESNNLILRYTYPDFMPKGIINRFVVILHEYIYQQKYVWKSRVILDKDNTKAEVIEYYGKREIKIRVTGNNKRGLMTVVTYELDKINDSYKRLNYQKFIPCNCKLCKNSQNPFTYEFKKLVERLGNRKQTIECGKPSYSEVQVRSLIDDSIDIKQLISKYNQDNKNKSLNFKGDNQQIFFQLLEKDNISGDFMSEKRNINIGQGNYNENIEGNYYEQKGDNNTMTNVTQTHSGSGDNVAGDKNTTNNYNAQDLKQAAADIQALLTQLEETYPTNTTLGKVAIAQEAIQRIDNDPKLAPRILSALKSGGTSVLDSILDHPAASFVIAALEDWQQTKIK